MSDLTLPVKWCKDCLRERPTSEFGKDRQTADGLRRYCKPCNNARARAGDRKAASKAWKQRNPQWHEDYYRANRDKFAKRNRDWRAVNPEASRAVVARRRTRMAASMTSLDKRKSAEYRKVLSSRPCFYCGQFAERMEVDHYLPVSRGGSDHWWNLVNSCRTCNLSKTNKVISKGEWRAAVVPERRAHGVAIRDRQAVPA